MLASRGVMLRGMSLGTPLAGMAAAALAAVCFDGAVLLQAPEARSIEGARGFRTGLLAHLLKRPRWLAGSALAVLGWPLQLLALSWAPVSLVQPTLALGLVVVLVGGARLLGERVGPRQWLAAATVIAGVTLLALVHPERSDVGARGPAAAATLLVLGAVVARPFLPGGGAGGPWPLVLAAGCAFALSALGGRELTVALQRGDLALAAAAGLGTAGIAGAGFLADMRALQRFDATRVAPPMFALETALPVLLAPVLFAEAWGDTAGRTAAVLAGLALVVAGGVVLGGARAEDAAVGRPDLRVP